MKEGLIVLAGVLPAAQVGASSALAEKAWIHGSADHTAADSQFRGKPGVTLIEPNAAAVRGHFGFTSWPDGCATLALGQRTLKIVPAPGHQEDGIAVHDSRTGWLLTADNVYPGQLQVKDWNGYRASIERLFTFSKSHDISAVLGSHIEMSRTGKLFPAGSTHQPDEASLVLTSDDLSQLHRALQSAGDQAIDIVLPQFVVSPIGAFQRLMSGLLKWLGVR
jgi:glyoxylase-like metal-dependent hydrolase (beta-lactamase superfamily II)